MLLDRTGYFISVVKRRHSFDLGHFQGRRETLWALTWVGQGVVGRGFVVGNRSTEEVIRKWEYDKREGD